MATEPHAVMWIVRARAALLGSLLVLAASCSGPAGSAPAGPDAVDDGYGALQGVALVVDATAGVLANDTVNGATITSPVLSPGTSTTSGGGTLELSADGSFTLTPLPAFTGADTFTYTLDNGHGTDTATVTVTFGGAPGAVADTYQTTSGATLTVMPGAGPPPDLLQNDALGTPAGALVSFGGGSLSGTAGTYAVGTTVPVGLGSLVVHSDGSFSFTPHTGFSGDFQFFYRLSNPVGSSDALVTITVSGAPTAQTDTGYTTPPAALLAVATAPTGLLVNDDLGNPTATLTSFGGGNVVGTVTDHVAGATASLGTGALIVRADGSFDFTSDTGYVGLFLFYYRITNAHGFSDGLVIIDVNAEPAAVDDTYAIEPGVTLTVPAGAGPPPGLLANDSLGAPVATLVSFGGGLPGGLVTDFAAGATAPVGGSGALTVNADGSFTFVPPAGLVGLVEFWYRIDNGSLQSDAHVSIDITRPLAFDMTTLPAGDTVNPYNELVHASGGTGLGYTFTLLSGTLPPGVSFISASPSARLIGLPTTQGSYPFTLQVTDSAANVATQALTLDIGFPPLEILTHFQLTDAYIGQFYSVQIEADGGSGTGYTWTVPTGWSLPAWATLTSGTPAATLSGTPPSVGTPSVRLRCTDSSGNFVEKTFNVPIIVQPFQMDTWVIPQGLLGAPFSALVTASGSVGPYTWALQGGNLPAGITLSSGTPSATLSGTPTSPGITEFTLRCTDGTSDSVARLFRMYIVNTAITIDTVSLPNGNVGQPYLETISASGGTGAGFTWSVFNGQVPVGTIFSGGTPSATIAGTPTQSGTFQFVLEVFDSGGNGVSRLMSITIDAGPLVITTPSPLPQGDVGVAYNQGITAIGGTNVGYAWSVVAGALPPGLTLAAGHPTAWVQGVPAASGGYGFTVRVIDSDGNFAMQSYTLVIAFPPLTLSPPALLPANLQQPYSAVISAAGGSGTGFTFAIINGSLPTGLTITPGPGANRATIAGSPTVAGMASFEIEITDSASNVLAFARSINVRSIRITTTSLPHTQVGAAYNQTIDTTGGTGTGYAWSITSGALPTGWTLTQGTPSATISGSTTVASQSLFRLRVTDSNGEWHERDYSLHIVNGLTIVTAQIPNAVAGLPYSVVLEGAGGTETGYVWTLSAALPPGLNLVQGTPNAQIVGTPAIAGSAARTITLTDSGSNTAKEGYVLQIFEPLQITTAGLPSGTVGQSYDEHLGVVGGLPSIAMSIVSGALPSGLSLGGTSITGTPTAAGTFPFTVEVIDSLGNVDSRALAITIGTLGFNVSSLPSCRVGAAYPQYEVHATGGTGPGTYTFDVYYGAIPPGVTLIDIGGVYVRFGGTPTVSGTYTIGLRVVDADQTVGTRTFVIEIRDRITLLTQSLPTPVLGQSYTGNLQTAGALGLVSWSIHSGALPAGLNLQASSTQTTTIQGIPTQGGVFTFTVRAQSGGEASHREFTFNIPGGITIDTLLLPPATLDAPYTEAVHAAGGAPMFTWSVSSGALPPGITLTSGTPSATLSGQPSVAGNHRFELMVIDGAGVATTRSFVLWVPALQITNAAVPDGTVGESYTASISASGGTASGLNFTHVAGTLPPNLALSTGGVLFGTPSTAGTFEFTVQVMDSGASTATQVFVVDIAELRILPTRLPHARVGTPYSAQLVAEGGAGSYAWTVLSGALPPGITLTGGTPVAMLDGMPTDGGNYEAVVQVQDGGALTATYRVRIEAGYQRWAVYHGVIPSPLYAVDLFGPSPQSAVIVTPNYRSLSDVDFTPSGRYLLYVGDETTTDKLELYLRDATGPVMGAPVTVSGAIVPAAGDVTDFWISPDSRWVAYRADQEIDEQFELYLVDISTGAPGPAVKLNGPLVINGDVTGGSSVVYSPDSTALLYQADELVNNLNQAFLVENLATPLPSVLAINTNARVIRMGFTNSGQFIYTVSGVPNSEEAVITDLATKTPVSISGAMVSGGEASDMAVAADESFVVYRADQDVNNRFELYYVPIAAGAPTQPRTTINNPMPANDDVNWFRLANNSRHLLYSSDEIASTDQLLWVDLLASPPFAPVIVGGNVDNVAYSPEIDAAFYWDEGAIILPLGGADPGSPIALSSAAYTPFPDNGAPLWAADGSYALIAREWDLLQRDLVHVGVPVPTAAIDPAIVISGPLTQGGTVDWRAPRTNGAWVVYISSESTANRDEVYGVDLRGPQPVPATRLNSPFALNNEAYAIALQR